jgi:hypothetical protein
MADIEISVVKDTARPALAELERKLNPDVIKRTVGVAVTRLVQNHLDNLGPNAQGWPSTGFYAKAARGTSWDKTEDGIVMHVENEDAPGAIAHLFHGGPIRMKDKMLTIPAMAAAYGHRATEFTNLRLAILGGKPALVIGKGGIGSVNFETGRERSVKGAGARAESMVMYWLKEEVTTEAHPEILPTGPELTQAAIGAVAELIARKGGSTT